MNRIKQAGRWARVFASTPARAIRNKRLVAQANAPMSVVFYHRVADTHLNDWTISRREFLRHIEYCQTHCEPISLDEMQTRVESRQSHKPSITFTFDDGYAENFDYALPLLAERKIPCVYFATVDHIKNQTPFPHDLKNGIPLAVNTPSQLRQMSHLGIEIGLHSRTHLDFSGVKDQETLQREIVEAKDELEQMVGARVKYFAFPYGLAKHLTQQAIQAVHEAGLLGFCSAYGAYNMVGRDAFHIRRFHGDPCFARFCNWLSFDPGKLRNEPKIEYSLVTKTLSERQLNENRKSTPTSVLLVGCSSASSGLSTSAAPAI